MISNPHMPEAPSLSAILFDLDNTLFDHLNSVRSGMQAIRNAYLSLKMMSDIDLIDTYNRCLQEAYDQYLRKETSYEEKDFQKVRLFFLAMGLPEPDATEIGRFRAVYDEAYMSSRRATSGSVETLVRLKENGYRLAIVSNGQVNDQVIKAETIGVRHLVECTCTSEEAGAPKPSPELFTFALRALQISAHESYMVGDSPEADVKGAIDVGLSPVLYDPRSTVRERTLYGRHVPVIQKMPELLDMLGIQQRKFIPNIEDEGGSLFVNGLGIDIVTTKRHCLHMPQEMVSENMKRIEAVFDHFEKQEYSKALDQITAMVESTAKSATLIDEAQINIEYPGRKTAVSVDTRNACHVLQREFSTFAEFRDLRVLCTKKQVPLIRTVTSLLQEYCDNLTKDHPRESIRNLRSAMFAIANEIGMAQDMVVSGERIDQ